MGDVHGSAWTKALLWVLLARRTAFQPDIGASPQELVFGENPKVPGDLDGAELLNDADVPALLARLRTTASKPPAQTAHHHTPMVNLSQDMATATHVFTRRAKMTPLSPSYKGPYPIHKRPSDSTLLLNIGTYANGKPKLQLHHWDNCKPATFKDSSYSAEQPAVGRKPKQNN